MGVCPGKIAADARKSLFKGFSENSGLCFALCVLVCLMRWQLWQRCAWLVINGRDRGHYKRFPFFVNVPRSAGVIHLQPPPHLFFGHIAQRNAPYTSPACGVCAYIAQFPTSRSYPHTSALITVAPFISSMAFTVVEQVRVSVSWFGSVMTVPDCPSKPVRVAERVFPPTCTCPQTQ